VPAAAERIVTSLLGVVRPISSATGGGHEALAAVHPDIREQTVQIIHSSLYTSRGPEDWFTGAVFIDTVAAPAPPARAAAAAVHFTPGARTAWHTHPCGQTIFVTEGIGRCQRQGGAVEEIPSR
jgi:hypothetical protein